MIDGVHLRCHRLWIWGYCSLFVILTPNWPLSVQISAEVIPAMAWNALASRYGRNCAARFMNYVQIGNAE